jgi:hypothetical protein
MIGGPVAEKPHLGRFVIAGIVVGAMSFVAATLAMGDVSGRSNAS